MAALPALAVAATAVSGVVSGIGTYMTIQSQQAMAEYNAQVARVQAEAQRRMGMLEEQKLRERARAFRGRQMALYGASGVELEGSPLLVMEDTAYKLARDAVTAKATAQFRAGLAEANARLYEMKAGTLGTVAPLGLFGSLLTTGIRTYATGVKLGVF